MTHHIMNGRLFLRQSVRDRLRAKQAADPDSIPVLDFTLMRRAPNSEHGEEEIDLLFGEGGAVYCPDCSTWLNGPGQWEDHKIGKKHRKNTQKKSGLQKGVCDVVPADDIKGSKKQVRKAGVKPKAAPASTKVSSEAPTGDAALSSDEESGHGSAA